MKRMVLLLFGLCLTIGMIGCKKDEAPTKPAGESTETPADGAAGGGENK